MLTVLAEQKSGKMARREQFQMSQEERLRRTFSENFKKKKVRELETGQTKVSDLCRQYEVSGTSVRRWLAKFGAMKNKPERLIVESQSDTAQLLELKRKVAELEQIIGQKQLLIDFKDKMIQLAEEYYQVEIKKKFSGELSGISGKKEKK